MPAKTSLMLAYKSFCKKQPGNNNLNKIARSTGIPYMNIHNAITGKHDSSAETWLTLMRYFDAVKIVTEQSDHA